MQLGVNEERRVSVERRADFDARLRAIEEWKHQIELQATKKMADLEAHHSKIDDAIELIAKTQASMTLKVDSMETMLRSTRITLITAFITATLMVGFFSLGPAEFLKAVLSR